MRAELLVCLSLLVASPLACGGRLAREGDDGTGGSTSAGASSSLGGSKSKGGASATAGAPVMGGAFTAGTAAIAGSATGGASCVCPDIGCAPGTVPVPDPNGCCFHCEPVCVGVPCPGIACGPGSHPEMVPGQCCPTCTQDNCEAQHESYRNYRRMLLEKYSSLGCMSNFDCTTYYEKNQCAVGCGVAMPSASLNNLDSNLQSYAQQTCSPSCEVEIPPCAPLPPAVCVNGFCR